MRADEQPVLGVIGEVCGEVGKGEGVDHVDVGVQHDDPLWFRRVAGGAGCDQHSGGGNVGRVVEDAVKVTGDAVRLLEANHHGQATDESEVVAGQVDDRGDQGSCVALEFDDLTRHGR